MTKTILLLLSVVIACKALTDEDVASEWRTFQERTHKSYKSSVEASRRLAIFKDNLEKIEAHNALFEQGEVTYKMGVTQFTDLTADEFSNYVNKYKMVPQKSDKVFEANPNYTAPASVDWRQQGAVTYVKNQGQCGSCWSFSATGALEGQAFLQKGQQLVLSEQNLVDCATGQYNSNGCNGGFMDGAFAYVRDHGICSEESYPYTAYQGYCSPRQVVLRSSGFVDVARNEASLQQAVAQVGPIAIGIDATSQLQNYNSGILVDRTCGSQINHGVLAVGYGSANGYDYWIIKNSWGDYWGEQGYFRLIRNYAACGITTMSSYPTL